MRRVKVLYCPHEDWWYKHLVGKEVGIIDKELKNDYIVGSIYRRKKGTKQVGNVGIIRKCDCELLS